MAGGQAIRCCKPQIVLVFFCQCIPVKEEVVTEITLDLKDPVLQRIYNFQDKRQADSLYTLHLGPWFRSEITEGN